MYNFGLHVAPYDSDAVQGFRLREWVNFEAAERACGFLGRSGYEGESGPECWGTQVFPRYVNGSGFNTGPSSLSLWADIESLMAFSYDGVHAEALKNARHRNIKQSWPPLVLWWVSEAHRPDWREGVERLEYLAGHGVGATAFTFKAPYGADGGVHKVDRARVKALADINRQRQADLLPHLIGLRV